MDVGRHERKRPGRTVRLKRQKVTVAGPRELVFEVVASAGKVVGEAEDGNLVEFESTFRDKVVKTVEVVTLESPTRIGYRWVEGPLDRVDEEIVFSAPSPNRTVMTYSGTIGAGSGLRGWLRTVFVVRPIFNKLVKDHLLEGKRLAEKRTQRSRVHPRSRPTAG